MGRGIAASVVGTVLILFAGCGGGASDAPLTRAEFMKQAEAICKEAAGERGKRLEKALKEHSDEKLDNAAQVKIGSQVLLPVLGDMVGRLSELEVPAQKGKDLEEMVEAFERGLQKEENDHALVLAAETYSPARKKAKALGIMECTQF